MTGESHPLLSCVTQITILVLWLHRTSTRSWYDGISSSLYCHSSLGEKWGREKCDSGKEKRKEFCHATSGSSRPGSSVHGQVNTMHTRTVPSAKLFDVLVAACLCPAAQEAHSQGLLCGMDSHSQRDSFPGS